jgi:hypothetical protein
MNSEAMGKIDHFVLCSMDHQHRRCDFRNFVDATGKTTQIQGQFMVIFVVRRLSRIYKNTHTHDILFTIPWKSVEAPGALRLGKSDTHTGH